MAKSLRDVFDDRHEQFVADYTFSEQDEVIRSLAVAGELLDLIFGEQEASLAMTAVRRLIAHGTRSDWNWQSLNNDAPDTDWRKTWSEIDGWDASSSPPFLDELHDLNAFGHYGITPIWGLVGSDLLESKQLVERLGAARDMPAWVEGVCRKIDQLELLVPRNADGSTSLDQVLVTRSLARARIKFDLGQSITVHELALLSGVTTKRIQNAIYAKTEEAPVVDKNGLISPEACEAWLTARDYHASIWKQVAALYPLSPDWGTDVEWEAGESDRLIDDYTFVPVANDGSHFVPSLRRDGRDHDGGYTIGAKGSERVIENFDAALEELRSMETPRWRRPNTESGKWGIVTGQTWKRVRRSDLQGL